MNAVRRLQSVAPKTSSRRELDAALARLRANALGWARASLNERIALLRSMLEGYAAIAEASVLAGCHNKGIDPASPLAGEEWLAGPVLVVRQLRLLLETLTRLRAGRPPLDPSRVRRRADGRVVVDLFPGSRLDGLLLSRVRAEVWMRPGLEVDEVLAGAARHYRTAHAERAGKVVLVLGAGNIAAIPPLDVLYQLFVAGKVCLLKLNPINAHVGPFIEKAFEAAIARGCLQVCYGGAAVGAELVDHPLVDEVHLTGTARTYDAIVWGTGKERDARRRLGQPRLGKPITAELGSVSPVLVVPGPYSEGELAFQAAAVAAAVTNNASFNCVSTRLLVLPGGWAGRDAFLQALTAALATVPLRRPYYPGTVQRWRELVAAHSGARELGAAADGLLPWTLLEGLDPAAVDRLFAEECFCPVVGETAVGGPDALAFLDAAVNFCNERLWGTLAATIIVHPTTVATPHGAAALERAIDRLRYGTVAINQWPAVGFALGTTPWGAAPTSSPLDIQSGQGWVHNTHMLEGVDKCVLRGPLVARPRPSWFANHKTAAELGRKLVRLESSPSWTKLPGLVFDALRG